MSFRLVPLPRADLVADRSSASRPARPPRDNPYDVIGKVFSPFWSVLLADTKSPNKACTMTIEMAEVSGRLPKQMTGATLKPLFSSPTR